MGKLQLWNHDKVLDGDGMRSEMLTKLLIYMLIHRHHPITVQELTEVLWEEEEIENPAGALKNLMYRLRTLLKNSLGDEEYLITGRGAYSWNPDIMVALDAEQFEQYCEKAKMTEEISERIEYCEKAVALYQGDFMPQIADKHWVQTLSMYYHSLFASVARVLAELHMQKNCYEDAERVCAEGLKYDRENEVLHCLRIKALICQNKQQLAMEYYEQAVKPLYASLGEQESPQMREVYEELLGMSKGVKAERLESVQRNMQEAEEPEGAYICGYPVFRAIYQLEARKSYRMNRSQYVMLLTLRLRESIDGEQKERFLLRQGMKRMEEVLKKTLRIGDVAAPYSASQYVVLLPACNYENCLMVSERIEKQFAEQGKTRRIAVKTDFEEVTNTSNWIR